MRKITTIFIVSVFTLATTAQNCDSTRLFSVAIKRSIHYSDSIFNLHEYPSSSEGIIDTNIYTEFFRPYSKYYPDRIGKYIINKIAYEKIKKTYKKGYKYSIKNNIKDYALYDISSGITHINKKSIEIHVVLGRKTTEIEYDTMDVRHEITTDWFMQESIYTYKYDCNTQKFILEKEKHSRGNDFKFNKARYQQEGKSLYKSSLELFIDTLAKIEPKTDTFNVTSSYLLFEPTIDTTINNKINGINVDFLSFKKEQYNYANRIPFKCIDYVITWECNGQLVYTINYKKHKKAFLQKNVVEKFIYTGNYYYKFNCETQKWDLAKTGFLKPNKRVKWK
jgi:hypothetical protein